MKQATKRFSSMLLALGLILGAGIVYAELIVPTNVDLQEIKVQIAAKNLVIQTQQAVITKVDKAIQDFESPEGKHFQDVISGALPIGPNYAGALAHVVGMVQASDLTFQSASFAESSPRSLAPANKALRPGETELVRPIGSLKIQVQASGSYAELKEFLRTLEQSLRLFQLESMTFTTPEKGSATYTYNIALVAPYQKIVQ